MKTPTMKRKVFCIEDKMFKTEPLFIINCTEEAAEKYLQRRFKVGFGRDKHNHASRATATVLHFNKVPWRVLWIESFNRHKSEDIAELVHELTHLVIRICEDKGLVMMANHPETGQVLDEPPAYMMDFFVHEFLKRV